MIAADVLRKYLAGVTDKVKTEGLLFRMARPVARTRVAFRRAVAGRARSKPTKRPSVIEGGKLALKVGQLKELLATAFCILPVTIIPFYDLSK